MKLLSTFAAIVFTLAFTAETFAQQAVFEWESESGICSASGRFNTKKYTKEQLADTLKLSQQLNSPHFTTSVTVMPTVGGEIDKQFAELEGQDVADLETSYKNKVAEIKALKLVKSAYWEEMRAKRLADLEKAYNFYRTTFLAWYTPAELKNYKQAPQCVEKYAEPLIKGGDALIAAWRERLAEAKKVNAFPEGLQKKFDTQFNSPDKMRYARMDVMTFGWWNCANAAMYDGTENTNYNAEFARLFTNLKEVCEEP